MIKVTFFLLLIFSRACFAQDPIGATINGNLIDLRGSSVPMGNAVSIEGTPYYNNAWSHGVITLKNKKKYEGVTMKLNLFSDDVLYIDENTKAELVALKGTIQEIEFEDTDSKGERAVFRCGYPSFGKNSSDTYYRVLADGKVSFLLQIKKSIVEEKQFNAASVLQKYRTDKLYFLFVNNSLVPLKRKKEDLLAIFSDQTEKVKAFMDTNRSNLKSNEDLIKIINYYNGLNN